MDLIRKLNSVGKTSFVENFELFKKYANGKIAQKAAIEHLMELGVSNKNGASIRIGNAKLIFEAAKENEALEIISNSAKVPRPIALRALKLIK